MRKKIIKDRDKLSLSCTNILLKDGDKVLQENVRLLNKISKDLKDTMEIEGLEYLSAPQIGYPYRVIAIRYQGKGKLKPSFNIYVNPIITSESQELLWDEEVDPCVPGKSFIYLRNQEVEMWYQTPNPNAEPFHQKFKGRTSTVLQQLLNHLDGITIDEIGLEIDDDFKEASKEDQGQVLNEYFNFLMRLKDKMKEDIKKDEVWSKTSDAISFIQSVRSGKTTLSGVLGVTKDSEVVEISDEELRDGRK